jgi:acetyl-CoA carboxylase alpha subunit
MFSIIKEKVKEYIKKLEAIKPDERVEQRIEKFNKMGVWK